MNDFEWSNFLEPNPQFPDLGYNDLDTIKINLNISKIDCQRMLDLLDDPKKFETSTNSHIHPKRFKNEDGYEIPSKFQLFLKKNNDENPQGTKRPIIMEEELDHIYNVAKVSPSVSKQVPICPSVFVSSQASRLAFQVIYGRYKPHKKNKEWSFDGFLHITPEGITLYKCCGRIESRLDRNSEGVPKMFSTGTRLIIGQWECELYDQLIVSEFENGAFFAPDGTDDDD